MSSKIQRTTNWVLCLSGFAAILTIVGLFADWFTLHKMGALAGAGSSIYTEASVGAIVSLLIPVCGWCGARNKNGKELCFFGFCNYLMGCCDCLAFCFLCTLMLVVTAIQTELSACHLEGDVAVEGVVSPNTCTAKDRSAIQDFCRQVHQTLVNASVANQTDADLDKASDLFVDTKCLETLHKIAVGVMAFLFLGLVLHCCSVGFHCVSGFCGFELKNLVEKEDRKYGRQSDSESDVSGSSSESD